MFPWNVFPFSKDEQAKLQQMKPEEMNQYVQNMINKIFQSSPFPNQFKQDDWMKSFQSSPLNNLQPSADQEQKINYSLFETHHFIFVRVEMESEEWLNQIKLYHTANRLIIEHIPEYGNKLTVHLPSLVKKKGTTAHFKDGMLEIQIPKNSHTQFSEIDITELQ